ncbi:MAG: D-alanyl-D-alanine carboxypeptidase/D-alanyl-D-alanine-endopeptidase [Kaiparowitsia implicata GSE-PSE-MK54-09C]|nr:D-alanyl-D-alanine carboxypeptidase/D-alanyl-D-alanine-endopeptidase [Kaiparowitsia implicata GSE-PSE-MK54-09C]
MALSLGQGQRAVAQRPEAESSNSAASTTAVASRPGAGICPADLERAIAATIHSSNFATAQWGISIESVDQTTPLYRHNPDALLIPASNIKLLTTAAALQVVGDRTPQQQASFEGALTGINRDSNNRMADDLLRRIGGQHIVRHTLSALGINPTSFEIVDGSGLSRNNRARPSTFVTLLKSMYTHSESSLFRRSLPVAGVSGTLRNRFRNTTAQGNVQAKTGTLRGVRALSGYLENDSYGTLAFSIVVNQPGQSGPVLLRAIDQIVLYTHQVESCG